MSKDDIVKDLKNWPAEFPSGFVAGEAATLIEQQAKEIEELTAALDSRSKVTFGLRQENQSLRNQIEELKCSLDTAKRLESVTNNENETLRTQNKRLVKVFTNLSSRMETAIECLVEAGGNKKYDPSWIRPMTLTRTEVNQACINAYNQIQVGLEEEAKAVLAEFKAGKSSPTATPEPQSVAGQL